MFQKAEEIQEALSRTGRRLALMDAGEYSVLVCGGSALKLVGLIERATNDVDVVAMVETSGEKLPPKVLREGLPEEVSKAAHHVALDLGLPTDWLNDSAIEVQRLGLPPGILRRAHPKGVRPLSHGFSHRETGPSRPKTLCCS